VKWYIATAQREFATYGFVGCPLTEEQLAHLYKLNIKLDKVYGIGCDVNAGVSFDRAVEVSL
jgi:hypothetical protein